METTTPPSAPVPDPEAAVSAPAPAKKRILVVDDEVSFARMVKINLEKSGGFEVRVENAAVAALTAAREFKPDLILLDVIMPNMDGGDVARQIKRDRNLKNTPIIFLTASVSKREAGDGGLNSGGELFLAKPVSVEALIACINEHLPKGGESKSVDA